MSKFQSAENFAKERYFSKIRINEVTPYYEHSGGVVARLKNLGITDEDTLSAGWLHDILENTETSFDEIDQRFGSRVAVLVMAISKDKNLPRTKQEEQYIKQLRESSLEVKLIKLCDISANLRDLKNSPFSKAKKTRELKKNLFYLNIIKNNLIINKSQFPGIVSVINGINDVVSSYGLRPIIFQ